MTARSANAWRRVVQAIGGLVLFFYALGFLMPLPLALAPFALLAALTAAGAMAISEAVVGILALVIEKLHKGSRP